jgi:hypothetical protein
VALTLRSGGVLMRVMDAFLRSDQGFYITLILLLLILNLFRVIRNEEKKHQQRQREKDKE